MQVMESRDIANCLEDHIRSIRVTPAGLVMILETPTGIQINIVHPGTAEMLDCCNILGVSFIKFDQGHCLYAEDSTKKRNWCLPFNMEQPDEEVEEDDQECIHILYIAFPRTIATLWEAQSLSGEGIALKVPGGFSLH